MKEIESGKRLLTGLGKFGLDEKTIEKVFEQAIRKKDKKSIDAVNKLSYNKNAHSYISTTNNVCI